MLAALITTGLAGCGGGGSDAPAPAPPGSGLPAGNQQGCALQYTLPDAAPASGADPLLPQQWHLNNTGQTGGVAG
ncbi:MAG TPA: hypothetical protein VM491_10370, partial [Burkholderiaceae bacterium]|nr:hypothetical protein [Burkholderiaceae bacterium]